MEECKPLFLGQLASPFSHPFPFAIYSQSLRTAIECGYWDVDIIPEDWHHFLKCWFRRDGDFRVIPVFLFMGNDAIEDENWFAANKVGRCRLTPVFASTEKDVPGMFGFMPVCGLASECVIVLLC